MPKFSHTADVHIRSLSRHDEFRVVLKAFTDDCRAQKVDHIFIGGDLFHTKTTGISPEYIDFMSWWLTDMAAVAPVHIVLGNHDLNLCNLSRQDAVSPIVSALNNPKIFLYKQSGTYRIEEGFNFCVFSCSDEQGWKDVKPIPGEVNIATFHGPVYGSSTETGYDIEEEHIKVDFFKDYDFAFLGDIHKPQTLALRDGKPWIAYPGSTLQNNYAEQIDHGYLIWDIKNKNDWSVTTRPLPNPKPYMTIDWMGSLEKTIEVAKKCPQGTRFRIRSKEQITQDDVHRLSETLKTVYLATEVTFKSEFEIDTQVVKTNATSIAKTDLRSSDTIIKLVKDYYKDTNVSHDELDSLDDHIKLYLSNVISSEDLSRYSKWTLRQLSWDNLFSYGEENIINFDKLNGVVGVFGPNRTGKSSIIGTLMYSLFNTTDRGPIKNINVCNVRKNYCSSKVIFDHDGTPHVIERQTTKTTNKKGLMSASTSLNLFKMKEDGEMEDMCGEQRTDTEKTIRSLIGNSDDFLMTSLSAQGEINQFISQGSSKRRSIFARFLDLDIFDKMYELSAKEVTHVKSQLKNFPDRNWDFLYSDNKMSSISIKKKIDQINNEIQDYQSTLNVLRHELTKLNSSPVTQSDIQTHKRRVDDIQIKFNEYSSGLSLLENELISLQDKQTTILDIIETIDADSLREKLILQEKLQKSINDLEHSYEKEQTLFLNQKKSLKILDEVPCGDEYPSCKFIKDAHSNKKIFNLQSEKVKEALRELNEAKKALEENSDSSIREKISKYEKAESLFSKFELEISKKETELTRLNSLILTTEKDLEESKRKLASLESILNKEENSEVLLIKEEINELTNLIKECDSKKIELALQLGKLSSDLEKLEKEKLERDSLLKTLRTHELISNAFSKKGIPLLVTKSQLPIVNAEISRILQGIVDFTLEVESDEDTDTLEIYIDYGDSKRSIELCSGMEKTISAIALRVAMINISSLPKPSFFIIDEGFGTLDSAGVESCNKLLSSLKRYFKTILVITHVDGIKDSVDHVLEITKKEKDSKIEFE